MNNAATREVCRHGEPVASDSLALASQQALCPPKELVVVWMLLLIGAGEQYGYTLHHGLAARGLDLQATSVYRWLAKFERDRWVVSGWSEPIDGPRRHVYRLTAEGRAALHEMTGLIAAMRDAYSTFLDAHKQAVARRRSSVVDEASTLMRRDATPNPPVDVPQLPSSQQPLRPRGELLTAWLLLQLDTGATYGYDLRRVFDAQRLSPDPAAMYRTLRQLEADKWVQSRWMSPVAGPRRRVYRLLGRGRRNLDEIARLIAAIRDAHDAYLVAYEHAIDSPEAGNRPAHARACSREPATPTDGAASTRQRRATERGRSRHLLSTRSRDA